MNKNIIQFIVNENGSFLNIPVGNIKAKSNLTTRLQVVTPISASTAVNYLIYDSKNIEKKQYLIPTGELGSEVVDPNNPLYSQIADWKVYEADIYAPILSVISKYRTGRVGVSFEFTQQIPNALCTNFVDYFGFDKPLPEFANSGDYYICENYNFWLNDKLYNKGDILVWYNEQWNNGGILPKGLTETIDISVDPAISYPTEEVDETAFGNAIGELADEVAGLEAKTNALESELDGKQDKVDLLLETSVKTVVGGINELENNYNVLNNNKLDKNFNLLVERTYAQLADFVAVRSGDQTLKMTLQTLRTYLTQGLVGLSFQIMESLPLTGVGNIFYLIPMVDTIGHFTDFAEFPSVGEEKKLYIADDEHTGGATGWYNWDIDTETYVSYNLGYLEYIWLEEISKFELIGSTQVDLTGYATETWVTNNFIAKTILNGGTTGQILAKKSDNDLDFEFVDKPQAPIQEIQLNGVEVPPVDGVVNIPAPTVSLNGVDMLVDPDKTYLVIKTFDEFTLLTGTTGSPNYIIEWGDGSSENVVGTSNPTHIYEKAGMYLITISGSFENGIVFGSGANVNKSKMIEVYGGSNYPTSIGSDAFHSCTNLTTANFPRVTSIGHSTFQSCSGLTTANFPRVTSIGVQAFQSCSGLTTANFPRITSIFIKAFQSCSGLTTANFPMVTNISDFAFSSCTNLITANFPNVTSIEVQAFSGCTNLNTANFPKVTNINDFAFNGLKNLKHLTIGNVTTTGSGKRFTNVKLDTLTISGTIRDNDITRIKKFFTDNGGTFSQSYEIKHGLQIEKAPTLPNDVVRKQDQTADKISYNNTVSGLVAENVQDAVDELSSSVSNIQPLYDVVVRTQQEFEDLIASPNWLGATSVAFVGDGGNLKFTQDVVGNLGLKIPETVKNIKGFNNAIIEVYEMEAGVSGKAALYYDNIPPLNDYSIEDIEVRLYDVELPRSGNSVFLNLINMTNCTAISEAGGRGFDTCYNLINPLSIVMPTYEQTAYGFSACTNIVGGRADVKSTSTFEGIRSVGFIGCSQLLNCRSKATDTDGMTGSGIAYFNCSYGSNNRDEGSTTSATGGTMTKWSSETND